jgi:hypothetical protein
MAKPPSMIAGAYDQPDSKAPKEDSPATKIKKMANDEKMNATRMWVAGHLTDKEHAQVHRRAAHAIKNAHKLAKSK